MENIVLIVVVILGIFILFRQFNSIRKGEPKSDELSKLTLQKASSVSFYVSLYFWLIISFFSENFGLESEQLIGLGITGMAIIFAISWVIIKALGFRNE